MLDANDKKHIQTMIDEALKKAMDFSTRKRGDTPTDANQLTPQKYVDMNGTTANRPSVASVGQQYFSSTLSYPIFFNGSNWVSATGSVVAAP